MRYVIIALTIYLAVAIQTTLVDAIAIGQIAPHVSAMAAVAVVLLHRTNLALAIAAAIGLLEDALWPGRMGVAMAWYLLLSWGLLEICERFDLQPLNRRVAATGLFAGMLALGEGATRYALREPTVGLSEIGVRAVGVGLYTAALAAPFWLVLNRFENAWRRQLARYEI